MLVRLYLDYIGSFEELSYADASAKGFDGLLKVVDLTSLFSSSGMS